jgi:hypothetical protein
MITFIIIVFIWVRMNVGWRVCMEMRIYINGGKSKIFNFIIY